MSHVTLAQGALAKARQLLLQRAYGCTLSRLAPKLRNYVQSKRGLLHRGDYVAIPAISTAEIVLKQLPTWFADCNLVHAQRALKYRSPEEFKQD